MRNWVNLALGIFLVFFQIQTLQAQFQEGKIKKRKGELLLVNVSLGWELTNGQNLLIFRNIDSRKKEIGKGQVLKTGRGKAVIKIVAENSKYKIKKGDWVASQNNDYATLLTEFDMPRSVFKIKVGTGATPLCNLNEQVRQAYHQLQTNNALSAGKIYSDRSIGFVLEYARQIGKRLKPSIAVDYISNRISESEQKTDGTIEVGQKIQNLNLTLNLNYYYEEFFEKFKLFAGAGAGVSFARLSANVKRDHPMTPESNIDAQGTSQGIRITEQFSLGLEINITRNWGISFEGQYRFRRIRVLSNNFSGTNADAPVAVIWDNSIKVNEMDFSGGLITLGLAYYR